LPSTFITQAIINGTVFYKLKDETSEYFSRGGVIFLYVDTHPARGMRLSNSPFSSLLWTAISSLSEIPALFNQRAIVVKHAKAAMYHPFVEAAALTLVDIPITFITIMAFSAILYFMVGLQSSASQFL
jgi:ATP-binding cassette subfamily G (WHITE) protein 2 (SNQ2)